MVQQQVASSQALPSWCTENTKPFKPDARFIVAFFFVAAATVFGGTRPIRQVREISGPKLVCATTRWMRQVAKGIYVTT